MEIVSSSAESKENKTEIELTYSINAGDRFTELKNYQQI